MTISFFFYSEHGEGEEVSINTNSVSYAANDENKLSVSQILRRFFSWPYASDVFIDSSHVIVDLISCSHFLT